MTGFVFSDERIQNSSFYANLWTGNYGYGHSLLGLGSKRKFDRFFDEWRKDQNPCDRVGATVCQVLAGMVVYPVCATFTVIGLGTNVLHLHMSNNRAKSVIQKLFSKDLEIGTKELVPNKPDSPLSRKVIYPFSIRSSTLSNENLRRYILSHVIKKIDESTLLGIFLTRVDVTYEHDYAITCTRTLTVKLTFNLPDSIKMED